MSCETPTKEEIRRAVGLLKSDKAAGTDRIPAGAFKADLLTLVGILHALFWRISKQEKILKDWKEPHVVKSPKKGNLCDCNN